MKALVTFIYGSFKQRGSSFGSRDCARCGVSIRQGRASLSGGLEQHWQMRTWKRFCPSVNSKGELAALLFIISFRKRVTLKEKDKVCRIRPIYDKKKENIILIFGKSPVILLGTSIKVCRRTQVGGYIWYLLFFSAHARWLLAVTRGQTLGSGLVCCGFLLWGHWGQGRD